MGIGGVLSQFDDVGRECVIVYGSHLLWKPVRRYCVAPAGIVAGPNTIHAEVPVAAQLPGPHTNETL